MNKERIIEEMARLDRYGEVSRDGLSVWSQDGSVLSRCPNYLEDDNAALWIVRGLDREQKKDYAIELFKVVVCPDTLGRWTTTDVSEMVAAECPQKAEALLRMANKWEEGE